MQLKYLTNLRLKSKEQRMDIMDVYFTHLKHRSLLLSSRELAKSQQVRSKSKPPEKIQSAQLLTQLSNSGPKKIEQNLQKSQTMGQNGTTDKKKSSYTYWVRERQDIGVENKPTKIEDQVILQKMNTSTNSQLNTSQSAWNTAGTWEDKTLNKNQLQKAINSNIENSMTSGIQIVEVVVTKGEGQLIMVRGKRKMGYELDCEVKLDQNRKAILKEITDDEDDCLDFKLIPSDSSIRSNEIRKDIVKKIKSSLEMYKSTF